MPRYTKVHGGQFFGDCLYVMHRTYPNAPSGHTRWMCVCGCGAEIEVLAHNLLAGRTKSCGQRGCTCGAMAAQRAVNTAEATDIEPTEEFIL